MEAQTEQEEARERRLACLAAGTHDSRDIYKACPRCAKPMVTLTISTDDARVMVDALWVAHGNSWGKPGDGARRDHFAYLAKLIDAAIGLDR